MMIALCVYVYCVHARRYKMRESATRPFVKVDANVACCVASAMRDGIYSIRRLFDFYCTAFALHSLSRFNCARTLLLHKFFNNHFQFFMGFFSFNVILSPFLFLIQSSISGHV